MGSPPFAQKGAPAPGQSQHWVPEPCAWLGSRLWENVEVASLCQGRRNLTHNLDLCDNECVGPLLTKLGGTDWQRSRGQGLLARQSRELLTSAVTWSLRLCTHGPRPNGSLGGWPRARDPEQARRAPACGFAPRPPLGRCALPGWGSPPTAPTSAQTAPSPSSQPGARSPAPPRRGCRAWCSGRGRPP